MRARRGRGKGEAYRPQAECLRLLTSSAAVSSNLAVMILPHEYLVKAHR